MTAESFGIERSDRLAGRTADDNGVSAVGQGRKVDPQEAASKGEFWDAIIDSGDVGVGGGDVGSKKSMFFWGRLRATYGLGGEWSEPFSGFLVVQQRKQQAPRARGTGCRYLPGAPEGVSELVPGRGQARTG